MSSQSSATATQPTDRVILLDRVNCLLTFDRTGCGAEEAMALMVRHQIGADELNTRRATMNRPIYRPTTPR